MRETFVAEIVFVHTEQKINLKKYKKVCENHDYWYIKMHEEDNKVLKHNHGEKSMKVPVIINADFESLLKKEKTCHNNPKVINN